MAIKRSSKISTSFSSSSMTDLIFLLLVFFVLATTLISDNPIIRELKVSLPSSDNKVTSQTDTTSAIVEVINTEDGGVYYKFNSKIDCKTISELEYSLEQYYIDSKAAEKESPVMHISLMCDRDMTSVQDFVDVATMIQMLNVEHRKNSDSGDVSVEDKYKMVIATQESESK